MEFFKLYINTGSIRRTAKYDFNISSSIHNIDEFGQKRIIISQKGIMKIVENLNSDVSEYSDIDYIQLSVHGNIDMLDIIDVHNIRIDSIDSTEGENTTSYIKSIRVDSQEDRGPIYLVINNLAFDGFFTFVYESDLCVIKKCNMGNLVFSKKKINESENESRYIDLLDFSNNDEDQVKISRSTIEHLGYAGSFKRLIVENSKIDTLSFTDHRDFYIDLEKYDVDNVEIYDCLINDISIYNDINHCKLYDCEFKRLFIDECKITNFMFNNSRVNKYIDCKLENFVNPNVQVMELLLQRACYLGNENAILDAKYDYEKIRANNYNYLTSFFLDATTGYGYKPHKAVKFIILSVIIFAALFVAIDICVLYLNDYTLDLSLKGLTWLKDLFVQRFYYSSITFTTTGYSDMGDRNIIIWIGSFIESCLGVSVLSMFVYSLTKSHLK